MIVRLATVLAATALLAAAPVAGQDPSTTTAAPATTTTTLGADEGPPPDVGFTSPQSTMRGYFQAAREADWAMAAEHLDLRRGAVPRQPAPIQG